MICIAWADFNGVDVSKTETEWRNGILQFKLITGTLTAQALNFSNDESRAMMKRAKEHAATLEADHDTVIVGKYKTLDAAKKAAMAKTKKEYKA